MEPKHFAGSVALLCSLITPSPALGQRGGPDEAERVPAAAGEIVVAGQEPVPASPWTELFVASCGNTKLELRRPMRPLGSRVIILINGGPTRGNTEPLEEEFGQVGAAYRFSFACSPQQPGAVDLHWVRGLVQERGRVAYRSGVAAFRDGALVHFSAGESSEDNFWYR